MKTMHTKGRWIEHPKAKGNIIEEQTGRSIATCMGYSSNSDNGKSYNENLANAALIAQVPNLLTLAIQVAYEEGRQTAFDIVSSALGKTVSYKEMYELYKEMEFV